MMPPVNKDRKSDENNMIRSAAKSTVAFVFFGILAFVGSWWVSLGTTVAKLREEVAVIEEKQNFMGPWLYDAVKELKADMKELNKEMKDLSRRK